MAMSYMHDPQDEDTFIPEDDPELSKIQIAVEHR